MKVTMYELLGMVKDGKAPKKIIFENQELKYDKDAQDYIVFEDGYLFYKLFSRENNSFLTDEVEILDDEDEEKELPEKLDIYEDEEGHYFIDKHCKKIYITCDEINFIVEEFNEIIDYLEKQRKGE